MRTLFAFVFYFLLYVLLFLFSSKIARFVPFFEMNTLWIFAISQTVTVKNCRDRRTKAKWLLHVVDFQIRRADKMPTF